MYVVYDIKRLPLKNGRHVSYELAAHLINPHPVPFPGVFALNDGDSLYIMGSEIELRGMIYRYSRTRVRSISGINLGWVYYNHSAKSAAKHALSFSANSIREMRKLIPKRKTVRTTGVSLEWDGSDELPVDESKKWRWSPTEAFGGTVRAGLGVLGAVGALKGGSWDMVHIFPKDAAAKQQIRGKSLHHAEIDFGTLYSHMMATGYTREN